MNKKKLLQYTYLISAVGTIIIFMGIHVLIKEGNWFEFLFL